MSPNPQICLLSSPNFICWLHGSKEPVKGKTSTSHLLSSSRSQCPDDPPPTRSTPIPFSLHHLKKKLLLHLVQVWDSIRLFKCESLGLDICPLSQKLPGSLGSVLQASLWIDQCLYLQGPFSITRDLCAHVLSPEKAGRSPSLIMPHFLCLWL